MNSDIYEISSTLNQIQKKHMPNVSEDTLFMGIFGYMNEIFSNNIQNSIMMATEWGNEAFPIRAKFDKTILTNAVTYNVENLNAIPARMDVMLGFVKHELDAAMTKDMFVLDKNCKIMIEDYEFHLDYDIIITKDHITDGVYSARYDITRKNPISNITNPYLNQPPIVMKMDNDDFVFISCTIRQIEEECIYKKVISNNILENRNFDFTFDKQLASFDVIVDDGQTKQYLTPIFEGMPLNGTDKYCFYTYLDTNTIRVKFDKNSYEPKLNSNITIIVKNTRGSEGNFIYKDDVIVALKSNTINYKNMAMLLKPITGSTNGIDRKSIKDLKEIIPKEILSRGNIINNRDLQNFFNNLIDHNNKLLFFRRRDNQFERLYYAYMLVKDEDGNIIPTNTINLDINSEDFDIYEDGRYILNPGNIIKCAGRDITGWIDNKIPEQDIYTEEDTNFLYTSPFTLVVNKNPLSISYYLNQINRTYEFKYSYINNTSMQFLSNGLHCYKNYIDSKNYKLNMDIIQTMNADKELVKIDEGKITESNILPILVITINNFNYYIKGNIKDFNKSLYQYNVEFNIDTDNIINKDNRIKLNDIYIGGSSNKSDIYVDRNVQMSVYILAKFNDSKVENDLTEIRKIIPDIEDGYTLCNRYDTLQQVDLFYNYSNVIKSKVSVTPGEKGYDFKIKGLPVSKYSYINDIERCNKFMDDIQYRKVYIDNALNVIENSFNVDLKFFNTYGPSKMFNIGYDGTKLDKVNLTLNFRLKLYLNSDKRVKERIIHEIKSYIENINNDISSIHMSNLTTDITNKFKSDIQFIEFVGINKYNSLYQYLEKTESGILDDIPEFLNINLSKDLKPDINITLV